MRCIIMTVLEHPVNQTRYKVQAIPEIFLPSELFLQVEFDQRGFETFFVFINIQIGGGRFILFIIT